MIKPESTHEKYPKFFKKSVDESIIFDIMNFVHEIVQEKPKQSRYDKGLKGGQV